MVANRIITYSRPQHGKCSAIFLFLHKFIDLREQEFNDSIRPYLQVRHFRKKQPLCKIGEVEDYLNFILKGLVLKYYKKGEGDMITQISTEGHIIHSQESFHSRTPSEYCVEAVEPTTVISITYDNLEKIYSTSAKMERLGRLVVTFSMVVRDKWWTNMIRLSPRERFLDFINKNPELLQRIPQKYLASYLNIQPETFSRFKHMLKEKRVHL